MRILRIWLIILVVFQVACSVEDESANPAPANPLGQFEYIDRINGQEIGSCCFYGGNILGADSEGNVIVLMMKSFEIFANRYDVNSGWGTPVKLDNTNNSSNIPLIAVAANGNALALWSNITLTNYYLSHYDRKLGWAEPITIKPTDNQVVKNLSVSVDADENYHLVWSEKPVDGTVQARSVKYNLFLPASGLSMEKIISESTDWPAGTTINVNSKGDGFATWLQKSGTSDIHKWHTAKYSSVNGWSLPEEMVSGSEGTLGMSVDLNGEFQFVVDSDGEGFYAYQQSRDTSSSTYEDDIFTHHYTNSSGLSMGELLIVDAPGRISMPQTGISGDDTIMLVWNEGDYFSQQSWYRLFNKATGWTTRKKIGDRFVDRLSVNMHGNAIVYKNEYSDGRYHFLINRYTKINGWAGFKEVDIGDLEIPTNVEIILDEQNVITATFDNLSARIPF